MTAPVSIAALPGKAPLDLYQGDDFYFVVTVVNLNLTGATGSAQVRQYPGATVHVDMDVTIVAPDTINISLLAANAATLQPGPNVWDLQVTVLGMTRTLLAGPVTVWAEVTK